MGFGDTFGFCVYTDDHGDQWSVKISLATKTAGGFADATVVKPWPYHNKRMRHITGVDLTTGKEGEIACASLSWANSLIAAGSWTNSLTGVTYTVRGYRGEHRDARAS